MLRKLTLSLLLLAVLAGGLMGATLVATAPEPPPSGSESARRLEPGPFGVGERDFRFVDTSRPTAANGEFPGAASRILESTLWFPLGASGELPLLVYSHGFMSRRDGGRYVAEHLASLGMVVVSADYPLTNFEAPGGPKVDDAANQPADVAFLIDTVLALEGDAKPFGGRIDPQAIGAVGLSLGGLTTTLVSFHPRLRDPRIRAAVSIAGPGAIFSERFFATADVPFLMIAGTADAMVAYGANAQVIPERAETGALLTLRDASHTGFANLAEPLFRFSHHPDGVGCGALLENIDTERGRNPFPGLGGEEDGIVLDADAPMPCQLDPLPEAMHPGRQHMITKLAVADFFTAAFAADLGERRAAANHLAVGIPQDFPEASFVGARSGMPPALLQSAGR